MGIIKIKLAVDRSQKHVLFADAGSDFVDILLGFLMLPLSAVHRVADLFPQGCLTNLSDSVNHLKNSELLRIDVCHGIHLTPTHNDVLKYAVALLRAVLTSKTALTDVFISRLEEQSSPQNIQIFAKIPCGKTIIVEVARSDTIATVKSRIKDKVFVPARCRHELLYGNRYLKDSCTVAEYNIFRDCTVICKYFK